MIQIHHRIVSSLFTGLDQNQFVELFETIEQSELIEKLNICQDINKQIAEYSVGEWGICENRKWCDIGSIQIENVL